MPSYSKIIDWSCSTPARLGFFSHPRDSCDRWSLMNWLRLWNQNSIISQISMARPYWPLIHHIKVLLPKLRERSEGLVEHYKKYLSLLLEQGKGGVLSEWVEYNFCNLKSILLCNSRLSYLETVNGRKKSLFYIWSD